MSQFDRDVGATGNAIGSAMQAGFNNMGPGQQSTALVIFILAAFISWLLDVELETLLWFSGASIAGLIFLPRFTILVLLNALILNFTSGWVALALVYFACFFASFSLYECDDADQTVGIGVFLGLISLGIGHYFDFPIYHLNISWHDYVILLVIGFLASFVTKDDNMSIIAHFLFSTAIFYGYCSIFAPGFLIYFSDIFSELMSSFNSIKPTQIFFLVASILLALGYKKIAENFEPQSFSTKLGKLLIILLISVCILFWSSQFFGKAGTGLSMVVCALFVLYLIFKEVVYFCKKAFK